MKNLTRMKVAMYNIEFRKQVELLLRCLPALRDRKHFALKGGTAINLFIRNMPRLSVDIDLTYLPLETREESLTNIRSELLSIKSIIQQLIPASKINEYRSQQGELIKLNVNNQQVQIKIEPNFILRGALLPIEMGKLCDAALNEFGLFIDKIPMLATVEIFAGKICAALSRQHPRDLFDVQMLFQEEGLTDKIRQCFVIYLASNPRPIHELLSPNLLDITQAFEREFHLMTVLDVNLKDLLETRDALIKKINIDLTENERLFLLSLKQGDPQWQLMPFGNINKLPALQWKLINIEKMDKKKHQLMVDNLKRVLNL